MKSRSVILIAALVFVFNSHTFSQSSHYWTEQYGTRSILLSNSIIGGSDDLGTVYYNPGRLALIDNAAFLLSAKMHQLNRLKIKDAVDEGEHLTSSKFGGVPSLAAGTFKVKFLDGHHFAYAFLTRRNSGLNFTVNAEKEGDVIEGLPGNEIFTGSMTISSKSSEEWLSGTWSYAFTEKFSVGVTNVFAIAANTRFFNMQLQSLSDDGTIAQFTRKRSVDYTHYGLLWKIGFAFKQRNIDFGLTVTTPKIHLKGEGSYLYEEFLSGIPEGLGTNLFESNSQSDFNSYHKTPLSIGGGASFKFGKYTLHTSAEWYNSIKQYTMVDPNPFVGQSTGRQIEFKLIEEANSVFNYGLGIEMNLSEKLSLYGSYSSDKSFAANNSTKFLEFEDVANNSTLKADINHIGAGFVLKLKGADITLGSTYAFATTKISRPIDFPDENQIGGIFDSEATSDLYWDRWRFIFSFSVPFLKDVQKKWEEKLNL